MENVDRTFYNFGYIGRYPNEALELSSRFLCRRMKRAKAGFHEVRAGKSLLGDALKYVFGMGRATFP